MAERVAIRSDGLSALIDPLGAELVSLRDADGRELMTDADPAFWTGHAPILFPIVGRLNGDVLRLDGRTYPMKQHGFARRMAWEVVHAGDGSVALRLRDDAATRASYPFAFDLSVAYTLDNATLSLAVHVSNPGHGPLPMSFGWHPAFAWPLPYGRPRDAHRIMFERDEGPNIVELEDGLFAATRPSPLAGRDLALADALFADDALIWSPVASQSVTYGADAGPRLRVDFPETPDLGIWTKPGAAFVCIEPWHGHADPAGFTGDFRDKPGVFEVAPGDAWRCDVSITLEH